MGLMFELDTPLADYLRELALKLLSQNPSTSRRVEGF